MSDPVEDAYKKSQENRTEYVEVESEGIVDKQLISDLKEIKGEINLVYSKLIAYRNSEDFEVYHDPETDDYYFIDPDTGDEIDCDHLGNPLED